MMGYGESVRAAARGGGSASVAVEVSPLVTVTEPHVSKRGRTWVSLAWEPYTRASSYSVQAYLGGAWSEVGSAPGTSFKVKGPQAGRASAVSRTQRHIMRTGTYGFPNWSGRAKLVKRDRARLIKLLEKHDNNLGENGSSARGVRLERAISRLHCSGFCVGMASSCFLDICGSLDVRAHVKKKGAKSLHALKRTKRLTSLLAYCQLLQCGDGFSARFKTVKLREKGKYKPLKKNKKLERFVGNAWDRRAQVLYIMLDPYRYDSDHAMMVLPFVKDRVARFGYYELRAYDPDSPGKMLKIEVHSNGELSIPAYFGGVRDNPIYKIQYAATDYPWAGLGVGGR